MWLYPSCYSYRVAKPIRLQNLLENSRGFLPVDDRCLDWFKIIKTITLTQICVITSLSASIEVKHSNIQSFFPTYDLRTKKFIWLVALHKVKWGGHNYRSKHRVTVFSLTCGDARQLRGSPIISRMLDISSISLLSF